MELVQTTRLIERSCAVSKTLAVPTQAAAIPAEGSRAIDSVSGEARWMMALDLLLGARPYQTERVER